MAVECSISCSDEGWYECQVSTSPPLGHRVRLVVVGGLLSPGLNPTTTQTNNFKKTLLVNVQQYLMGENMQRLVWVTFTWRNILQKVITIFRACCGQVCDTRKLKV